MAPPPPSPTIRPPPHPPPTSCLPTGTTLTTAPSLSPGWTSQPLGSPSPTYHLLLRAAANVKLLKLRRGCSVLPAAGPPPPRSAPSRALLPHLHLPPLPPVGNPSSVSPVSRLVLTQHGPLLWKEPRNSLLATSTPLSLPTFRDPGAYRTHHGCPDPSRQHRQGSTHRGRFQHTPHHTCDRPTLVCCLSPHGPRNRLINLQRLDLLEHWRPVDPPSRRWHAA